MWINEDGYIGGGFERHTDRPAIFPKLRRPSSVCSISLVYTCVFYLQRGLGYKFLGEGPGGSQV